MSTIRADRASYPINTSNPTVAGTTDTLAAAITSPTQTNFTLTGSGGVTNTLNGTRISIAGDDSLIVSGGGTTALTVQRNPLTATTHSNGATVNCPGHVQ